ncbi:hypothetical protein [Culicoidibacter larvae]|uniref:GNAT family N-acetyltransferase n=1 Tax=Culicoidibacter larvae TaxID=2579976 RepID=A0A5R8Q7I2_9FIRM|nr:hypothetical protein [Culicoidibacter larvae]TLG71293.1 hypothetical protein FEZ08_11120 [Culicoidibacter larvae]
MNETVMQLKLLSDLVWGDEFGRIRWMSSEEEWQELYAQHSDRILYVTRQAEDFQGIQYEKVVGMLIVVFPDGSLVYDEAAIVKNERVLSHPEHWRSSGPICYLSEIIIHPSYRHTGVLADLLEQFNNWCQSHDIVEFYATGVSTAGQQVLERFDNSKLISTKEENRKVYRITI